MPATTRGAAARHVLPVGTQSDTYVSPAGTDAGLCPQTAPCKTITYAESQTAIGGTIHMASGVYNQSADLTQPLHLEGAAETTTIIDGTGIDYTLGGYYGVLGINNTSGTAGTISVSNVTVLDPYITAAEASLSQSPVDIANYDTQVGDTVNVTDVNLGPAQDETDYPGIGYYSLNAQSKSNVTGDYATGMYQAYFAEGSGPQQTTFGHDIATKLVGSTYQGMFAPAAGIFALSDTSGALTVAANNDSFTGYDGYGIAGEAGYSQGNCTNNVCTGGLTLNTNHNVFHLTAAPSNSYGGPPAAISLYAATNDSLTANLNYSSGSVVHPDLPVNAQNAGGMMNVTDYQNTITVK